MRHDSETDRARPRLVIVTTVPDTFTAILRGQPAFLQQYYEVTVVSSGGDVLFPFARSEGVTSAEVPMVRGIDPLRDIVSILRMIFVLVRLRPDIVHSYTPKAGLVAAVAGFICRVPVRVHTFTGLLFPTSHGFRRQLLRCVDSLVCMLCTHIVAEGVGVRRDLYEGRVTARSIQIIGNGNIAGVDTVRFAPDAADVAAATEELRQRLALGTSTVFCFVGRINRDKGIDELMAAFARLASERDVRLLVAGAVEMTPCPPSTAALDVLWHHPAVSALGFLDDVRPVMLLADVLVLPSYREGFPNVVLQALSMGRPCIVTNINGSNEIITSGETGWVVAPYDWTKLYHALAEADSCDRSALRRMGEAGRRLVCRRFEQGIYREYLLDFYRRA